MAGVACGAVVTVAGDGRVLRVRVRLRVAPETAERPVIGGVRVAVGAARPPAEVLAGVDREVQAVVLRVLRPGEGRRVVAERAVGGEAGRGVIRIRGAAVR